MKNFILILSILTYASLGQASLSHASVRIVANVDGDIQLTKQQVRNLFLGGKLDENLRAVELPPANELRVLFNTKVIGLTEARLQSYWAQMRFSGRKKPPQQFENHSSALQYVLKNEGAVLYLSANMPVPDGLRVIYELKE